MSSPAICAKLSAPTPAIWNLPLQQIKTGKETRPLCKLSRFFTLFPEEIEGGSDALLHANLGFPAQALGGLAAIEVGQVDIAGAFGRTHDLRLVAGFLRQHMVNLIDRGAFA